MPCIGRLKKRSEFLKVAAARSKWVTPGLILQERPRTAPSLDPDIRVGFTVSRKVGNAVHRNRARRRLRAAVQAVLGAHARPGTDYVLIGRRGTLERPYGALCDDLRVALKRVGTSRPRRAGTKEMKQRQS